MAIFKAGSSGRALNFKRLKILDASAGELGPFSGHRFTLDDADAHKRKIFYGDELVYGLVLYGPGAYYLAPAGGTITGLNYYDRGKLVYSIRNMAAEFGDFVIASINNDLSERDRFAVILAGNDQVSGSRRSDTLYGFAGNDRMRGLAGNDVLEGGDGDDILDGGAGRDRLVGGAGNDVYRVDNPGDRVIDSVSRGTDTVLTTVSYSLAVTAEIEVLSVAAPLSTHTVDLSGNGFDNTMRGNGGVNALRGGGGADTLDGRGGADHLVGGLGNDVLIGGSGHDVFRIDGPPDALANFDAIVDFTPADDTISLSAAPFPGFAGGFLTPASFSIGAAAQDPDDRILYDPATGLLAYDADGSGAGAAIAFARLTPGLSLTAADFVIA